MRQISIYLQGFEIDGGGTDFDASDSFSVYIGGTLQSTDCSTSTDNCFQQSIRHVFTTGSKNAKI